MSSSVRWPTSGGNWQSQQLTHNENRTMKGKSSGKSHSWWWDSHNAPKNSKWLEDNLNDMDAKVKAMLKLIEEDADSFAKRAEMYYKKRPELISLVEEFYRAYRSLAERYDQLTGHIRQIPQEIQAQFGFSGDAPPGSPGSAGSVRRKAAGFSMFASPGTPKRSKEKGRKDGSDSSSSSSSDSDSDSKRKPKQSDEILRIQEENEQLRKDLDKGVAHHQALESRLAELQEELKSLQHQNVQLHRNAASAHSEIATLEADIERLKRENHALGEEASTAIRTAEKLQKELELAQDEQQRLFTRLEENGLLMQRLEEKIKELEARIVQLTEELLSRTASCQHLEQELVAVTEEKRSLLDDVSSKASQIVELEEEIARLQASLSLSVSERERHFELHQTLEKTLADVHVQFSSAREEKGKLSEELLFKVQHVQLLEQQLKQVQVALEGSEREKAGMVELLSKAESRLLDLQNEFGSMQEKLNGEIFMQTEEKDAYKKQVEELQAALAALHRENSRGVELQDILAKRLTDLELQLKDAKGALKSSEREKAEVTGLLSTVKTSLTELEGEFGSMEVKFNVEAQKKRALKAQVVELQAALEALQGEKNLGLELQGLLEKQLRDVEQQLKQVQEALEASDQEKSEGNRLLKELEVDFGSMQVKLNAEVKEKQALDALVEELQAALMALQGEKSQGLEFQGLLEKQLMYVKQQLKQVQEALEASDREKSEVNKLLDELENNFLKLQHEFGSMQEKLTGEISVLSEEKQVLKGQVVDLQAALAALHGERSRGMELHDVLEKRLMDLEQKLVQVQSALELAEKEKAEMGGLLSKANIHLTELQAEVISVQSRLREEISTLTQEKQVLIKQVEELQATLAAFHDEKSRGIELQDVFEKQLKELQLELSQAKHEASCLSDELAEKGGAISQLEGEVNSRDDIISSLQRDLVAKQKEGESLQNHLEECSNELQAFESEVQRLQSLLIESEDLARNLEAQIVEIQQNFELERMEVKKLRDDLEDKVVVVGRFEAEVQNRDILIASLHDDISTKLEEIQVLREEIKSMTTEKMTLSEESLVNLKKITKLQKELEETLETLAERTTFILNLEIEYKRLTEDLSQSQQKSVQHVSQWQLVTSDKERLELELLLLQEANSKLQIEVASKSSQVDRLMLDLKTSEKTVILTMEENAKLTADLDSEVTRSHITDEKCRLQEQVIYDLQEDKTKLLGLAEELKLSICKLQEEIIDLKVKSEDARQEKKNLELEIQGLRDELSQINGMNQEQSTQLLETISYLKVEINRLEVCLSSGTEQLQFFEKEQEKWNKDKAVMDESIDQLTKEKQELQDTILLWSQQMEKLQTEHTTLKTSSRDVESSLLFHQTEHSKMKSDLFEKSERIHWLEEELKRLQLDLSSSQEETRQLSIELQQVTEDLKDQLRAEQGKVRLLHDDIDRLQQGLLSVQEARTTDSLACQEHVKVFQIKEESLESQIIKLKGEIHDLDELCKELAGNLADKTKEQEVLQAEMEKLHQDLRKTRQQWKSAEAKCDSLASELAQEHESRATAQAACVKFQAEIAELVETIASLQAELQQLKEAKELLTVKVEAAVEQEKIDAMEIEMLLRALQGEHEGNGSHNIGEHSWHFEVKNSTFRHLKESMVNLLTDRSRIQEEAAAHAEHVKVLNLEIAKSGQMLDSTRGDYHTLFIKHESVLAELQALQLRLSQFQGQVQYLEEEKTKLHDQLLASGRDSDELSTQLLREKKELYEKLVVEGELVLRLQQELKMAREEIVESKRNIDGLHKQIEKLLIGIQEVSKAKEVQEKDFSQEVQQHVEEKASTLQSLTEALRALSVEKAEVQKHQDEILLKNQQLLRLEEELALLRATLLGKEQEFLGLQQHKNSLESRLEAEIRKLEESWTSWQEEKTSLESSLSLNQQKGMELQEQLGNLTQEKDKISLELQARVVALDMQQLEVHRLQKLLEESKLVIISLRDEKISVSEQHALSLGRCNDLEALCKSLQKQRAEHQAEKRQYEAQLSVIEELRKEALDDEEMMKLMHERVANKQQEIDQVQSINEDLKEIMRKFESEMESLKDQIIILQKKNTLLNEEVSTKASLVRELDQSFKSLKEKKVVFEGGFALAVGDVGLVQAEVDKLLEKISKLSELSVASGENLRKMEERICKLQVSNLNLRDEFSVLAKKEKSYVIAVRFMRAEFFCLVQRIKAMKQEKAEAAMQVELAVEAERKKNGEVLSGLQQELAFLREENKRQRTIIFDRAEEKREAIRQLCITLDFMQTKNRRLEGVINSVREKIQRRIAASNARR